MEKLVLFSTKKNQKIQGNQRVREPLGTMRLETRKVLKHERHTDTKTFGEK